jgi:STE24 endopeptidase
MTRITPSRKTISSATLIPYLTWSEETPRKKMAKDKPDSMQYNKIKNRLALAEPVIALTALALIQASGLTDRFAAAASGVFAALYAAIPVYAALFGLAYYAITFYPGFYRSYKLEHRFRLSNQHLTGWLKDEAKRLALSYLLLVLFMEMLYASLRYSAGGWWLIMAFAWIFVTVIIARLAPVVIIPLFFKFKPIGDPGLRERLLRLADRFGIKVLDVFRLDLSAKTKKANAALVGIGDTRRVLLSDTLLDGFSEKELEVVLAHELAHHKLGHIWKLILFGGAATLAVFWLVNISSGGYLGRFGGSSLDELSAFPVMMFYIVLYSSLATPLSNAFSRKLERSADSMALRTTGMPEDFISCMNKLARQNLSDPSPSRIIEILLYDHPPVARRTGMAEGFRNK